MRDYWLTQYILGAIGWGYVAVAIATIAFAAILPRRRTTKFATSALVAGLFLTLPVKGGIEYHRLKRQSEAFHESLTKARALFDKRCDTAGEEVLRTVDDQAGIMWMRWRPQGLNTQQFALDDPYGKDCSLEGCILELLRATGGTNEYPEAAKRHSQRYEFVESVDPDDGFRYRYTAVLRPFLAATRLEISEHVAKTGHGAEIDGSYLALQRVRIHEPGVRYGITWADLSTMEDRQHWIAGGSLAIVDLRTEEVIAKRVGYLIDTGQGSTQGFRNPWGWARSYAPRCPPIDERTWEFAIRLVRPTKQGKKK